MVCPPGVNRRKSLIKRTVYIEVLYKSFTGIFEVKLKASGADLRLAMSNLSIHFYVVAHNNTERTIECIRQLFIMLCFHWNK